MKKEIDIFKIKTNNTIPNRGKILISEPFLCDLNFSRSVILIIEHGSDGSMGIILNKQLPLLVNDIVKEFKYINDIPLYRGGPVGVDTLFYLHTLADVEGALPIGNEMYLNGDFNMIKKYILQGNPLEGNIRFFLGYSGWKEEQLNYEIEENTWMVSTGTNDLLKVPIGDMWKRSLKKLGGKYVMWSRFPKIPFLN